MSFIWIDWTLYVNTIYFDVGIFYNWNVINVYSLTKLTTKRFIYLYRHLYYYIVHNRPRNCKLFSEYPRGASSSYIGTVQDLRIHTAIFHGRFHRSTDSGTWDWNIESMLSVCKFSIRVIACLTAQSTGNSVLSVVEQLDLRWSVSKIRQGTEIRVVRTFIKMLSIFRTN